MKKCVMYLRRSTDKQDQSLDDQKKANENYAQEQGYEIVETYTDDAISGAATASRRAFLEMIEAAQANEREWHWILVYDVTRFGRQQSDEAGHYRFLLQQAGVEVKYVAEGFRGDSTDDLLLGVKQHMAHQMVLDVSKLTIRGQVSLAQKGRWCGGRPPYGYDLLHMDSRGVPEQIVRFAKSGERLILSTETGKVTKTVPRGTRMRSTGDGYTSLIPGDPERVAVLKRIFAMYVGEGVGLGSVASRLNDEGVPSPGMPRKGQTQPSRWSLTTVRDIIRNPAYRGASVWNRRSFSKFNRVKDGKAEAKPRARRCRSAFNEEKDWVVEEGQHEALVLPELWREAQREMKGRGGAMSSEQLKAAKAQSPYLLSGLVTCQGCGARWQGRKTWKGRKRPGEKRTVTWSYCCGGYIRSGNSVCLGKGVSQKAFEDVIAELALEYLEEFASGGGREALKQLLAAGGGSSPAEEKRLRESIEAAEADMERLVACLTPDLASVLAPRIKKLKVEIAEGEARLADLKNLTVTEQQAQQWTRGVVEHARTMADLMRSGSTKERRAVLMSITQEIFFDPATRRGEVCFFGVPRVETKRRLNEETTPPDDDVVSCVVAGARATARETTDQLQNWRKSFVVCWARMVA